jgi:hypothetical protein
MRTKEGRRMDDTWQQGKGGLEDDKTGEWPTLAKHRAAEKGGVVQASLIRARRSRPSKAAPTIPDPPLRLKVERRGGSGITFIVVDPGALIWPLERCTPDSGPPPLRLKVERQGGSGIQHASLIRARKSSSFELACRLPRAQFGSELRISGFLTPSFVF